MYCEARRAVSCPSPYPEIICHIMCAAQYVHVVLDINSDVLLTLLLFFPNLCPPHPNAQVIWAWWTWSTGYVLASRSRPRKLVIVAVWRNASHSLRDLVGYSVQSQQST